MTSIIELGTRVRFQRTLTRRMNTVRDGLGPHRWAKVWETTPDYMVRYQPEREGIVVGVRTLANGENTGGGWEDPIVFKPTEHFTAYLVAFDVRRKPVYVLPDDLTVVAEAE